MSCDTGTITPRVPSCILSFLKPFGTLGEHPRAALIGQHPRTGFITCAPQQSPVIGDIFRILEDGDFLILEDGEFRIIE